MVDSDRTTTYSNMDSDDSFDMRIPRSSDPSEPTEPTTESNDKHVSSPQITDHCTEVELETSVRNCSTVLATTETTHNPPVQPQRSTRAKSPPDYLVIRKVFVVPICCGLLIFDLIFRL